MARYTIELTDGTNPMTFMGTGTPAFTWSFATLQAWASQYAEASVCAGRTVYTLRDGEAIGAVRLVAPDLLMHLSADLSRVICWERRGYLYPTRERMEAT